jgi:hypothetical protein
MQLRLLLNVFLICSSTMYSMELTTTHASSSIHITDDLLSTAICSRLDRPAREVFRCTNKKYFELILPQDVLNKNYKDAHILQDEPKMLHWKSLGALLPHQEFANAIKKNIFFLARWLLEKNKVVIWDAYCLNIRQAVETSTIEEIVPVIKWLLDMRRPATHLNEYLSGYHFANNLVGRYPEVKKIVDVFKTYEKEEEARKRAASNKSYLFWE